MKRKATVLPLISVLLTSLLLVASIPSLKAVSEAPQIEWSKTYPRPPATTSDNYNITHIDGGRCFVQTSDGGYAIVGSGMDSVYRGEHTGGDQTYTGMIVKTDSLGNLEWVKTDPIFSESYSIFQTKDLGYIIVSHGAYLLKTDDHGNMQWNKTMGVSLSWATQASDGGYVLAVTNQKNALLIKTDEDGNLLWNKTLFSFPSTTVITSNLVRTDDGGYAMVGYREDYQSLWYDPNLYIIKTDRDGNLQLGLGYFLYYEPKSGTDPNGSTNQW